MSNDRPTRVTQTSSFVQRKRLIVTEVEKRAIRIRDWSLFQSVDDNGNKLNSFFQGRILHIGLLDGPKRGEKKVVWECDYTATDINKLGAVCLWYQLEKNKNGQLTGHLHEVAVKVHGFHPLSSYIVSVPPPGFFSQLQQLIDSFSVKLATYITSQ